MKIKCASDTEAICLHGEYLLKSHKPAFLSCTITFVYNDMQLVNDRRRPRPKFTGDRLKEGTKINLSLNDLGNVISALLDDKKGIK